LAVFGARLLAVFGALFLVAFGAAVEAEASVLPRRREDPDPLLGPESPFPSAITPATTSSARDTAAATA
jgi:hypothetical protein